MKGTSIGGHTSDNYHGILNSKYLIIYNYNKKKKKKIS